MQGGFNGWVEAGLPVRESDDYDTSPIDTINDTIEGRVLPTLRCAPTMLQQSTHVSLLQKARKAKRLRLCREPAFTAVALGVGVLATALFVDRHRTLQFLGAFGLVATFGTAPFRYNSTEVRIQ